LPLRMFSVSEVIYMVEVGLDASRLYSIIVRCGCHEI
jgi:hypothetical protein